MRTEAPLGFGDCSPMNACVDARTTAGQEIDAKLRPLIAVSGPLLACGDSLQACALRDLRDGTATPCGPGPAGYEENAAAPASATAWSCSPEPPLTPIAPTTFPSRLSGIPPAKIMILPSFDAWIPKN